MLENYQNYFIYAPLVRSGSIVVKSDDITIHNWHGHYEGIMNILRDGIETNYVQNLFITVDFGNGETIDLHINDYLINLLMWYLIVALDDRKITPKHIFFEEKFTTKAIKKYVDSHFILHYRGKVPNKIMNNVIADFLHNFANIDDFSMFLANTLNLEDSIELMNASQEYYDLLHHDYSDVPLEAVKDAGMEITRRAQDIIMDSEKILGHEHCLRAPFASGEGISTKQYRENSISIGTKPTGQGGIYNCIINPSYLTGGLSKIVYQFIDSATARLAQIISKRSVGDSGGFARILGLNNVSTYLHEDPTFDCGTQNYIHQFVSNKDIFKQIIGRYYKLSEDGQLLCIRDTDTHLIGKNILMRSPIFCASHSRGKGVCYHCYGELAHVNNSISVGRIASEIITSILTQTRLSSKHILESRAKTIEWSQEFHKFFDLDINMIHLKHDLDPRELAGWKLVIPFSGINVEQEDDFYRHDFYIENVPSELQDEGPFYNEYVTEFQLVSPGADIVYTITSNIAEDGIIDEDHPSKLYITTDMARLIRKSVSLDDDSDDIVIDVNELADVDIFTIMVENSDIGRVLDLFNSILNKKDVTKSFKSISALLESLQNVVRQGNINCTSIQLETLLSNQICAPDNHILKPNWLHKNEPYTIMTLNEALKDNPSVIISLIYNKLADALKYPLTFKKVGPSAFDLFFMRKPMKFLHADHDIMDIPSSSRMQSGDSPVLYMHKDGNEPPYAPVDIEKYIEPYNPRPKTLLED